MKVKKGVLPAFFILSLIVISCEQEVYGIFVLNQ
jgi:hypothetical protein